MRHVAVCSGLKTCMARKLRYQPLPKDRTWWRVAEVHWKDPLSPAFSRESGGRWNPPGAFATLYLNADRQTARCNVRTFIERRPYEPEDLRDEAAPILVGCQLPREQVVCDVHTKAGLLAAGLPTTYPLDARGFVVDHSTCQDIGEQVKFERKRGVHTRCAKSSNPDDLELAWFPASTRSVAREVARHPFSDWFWDR